MYFLHRDYGDDNDGGGSGSGGGGGGGGYEVACNLLMSVKGGKIRPPKMYWSALGNELRRRSGSNSSVGARKTGQLDPPTCIRSKYLFVIIKHIYINNTPKKQT